MLVCIKAPIPLSRGLKVKHLGSNFAALRAAQ